MWFKNLFKTKVIDFPKNTSWMLNDDYSPNLKNIKHCREFQALKKTKQSKHWHKEGNAYNHTLLVANKMHHIINEYLPSMSDRDKKILMISALCHDLGKATTTYFNEEDKDWHCKSHGAAGERITRNLLFDEPDYWMREEICWLVRWHMEFHHFIDKPQIKQLEALQKLSMGISTIQKLLILNVADTLGSISKENTIESVEEKVDTIKIMATNNSCYTKPYYTTKNKSPFNMYVLIGVPGCGKNTYIQNFFPNIESISRDDIREEMLDGVIKGRKLLFDNTKEAIVSDIVNSRIKACCEQKKSFIINQTNLKKKYREQLKEQANKYGSPNIIYVYIEAPSIAECKRRRGNGKWDSIIDRMWGEFEFPDRSECNELLFYKQK